MITLRESVHPRTDSGALQQTNDDDGQQERHQTKSLMSTTITLHLRYNYLYISFPSNEKQQREMGKFCVV